MKSDTPYIPAPVRHRCKELEEVLDTIETVKQRLRELVENDLMTGIGAKNAYDLLSAAGSALVFDGI